MCNFRWCGGEEISYKYREKDPSSYKLWQFPDTMEDLFKKISTFLAWAVFSFLSHFSAAKFLSSSEHLTENVILLTTLQMAAGSVLFPKRMISGDGSGEVRL